MTNTAAAIHSQALGLSLTDRADLAAALLDSLETEADVKEAWRAELARRVAEIRSGRAVGRPLDEVLTELRERYP